MRAYYQAPADRFVNADPAAVLGELARRHSPDLAPAQRDAWQYQIEHLQTVLRQFPACHIFLEFSIPRMGKRADAVLLLNGVILVLEYKVHARSHSRAAEIQVLDYALDLKNFHAGSHASRILPVAISTDAPAVSLTISWYPDSVGHPVSINVEQLSELMKRCEADRIEGTIDAVAWCQAAYKPTPTIVEASQALYSGHQVSEITRSDAGVENLSRTALCINSIIDTAKREGRKTICFVTGVPGSGKTLAGLNVANQRRNVAADEHAVFLSGNGPLVKVLQEALARDEHSRTAIPKKDAMRKARALIQNVHHFRDENLKSDSPPIEKVVVFDEAQRAWDQEQTAKFMKKKGETLTQSEPEFLLSVMDRHTDWCTVVCLVGGGQEINTGEAGLTEWLAALQKRFPHWRVYISDQISGPEYTWKVDPETMLAELKSVCHPELHLQVAVRSFRSKSLAAFVQAIIAGDAGMALDLLPSLRQYPLVLTRSLSDARNWLRSHRRGSERCGLVASSNALRLKPHGLHVKCKIQPEDWFLNDALDVRSCDYLEDVATEFDIQGLELDWVGVCWDANFRHTRHGWSHYCFKGTRWQIVKQPVRQNYLANAYRVLLTRARQGMVIYVPLGSTEDHTCPPEYYSGTYDFLRRCGIPELG